MKTLNYLGTRTKDTRTFWEWAGGFSVEFSGKWWINFPHPVEPFIDCMSKHHAYATLRSIAKGQGFELEPCPEIEREIEAKNRKYDAMRFDYATANGIEVFAEY